MTGATRPPEPHLSVVVPTFNRPDLLAECLARLAPGVQTLAPARYDVRVTDDGTDERSRRLVSERYSWARWSAGPRRGPASNRNAGARLALGEWLVFIDDDCLPDAGWLAAIEAATRESCDVAEGRTVCRAGLRTPLVHAPINERGGYWWSCNLEVRRSLFEQLGGFDERFTVPHMEDVEFRERARVTGARERFVPDAVVDHPPRRVRWGAATGDEHAAEVLFAVLHHRPLRLWRLMFEVSRVRLRNIFQRQVGTESASAIASWLVELFSMLFSWNRWWREAEALSVQRR